MDLRQLRYFLAVVEHGSITRASRHLAVAQPALSLHVRAMEEALGTRLLDRSHTGVTATEAGALLALRARTLLEDLARAEDEIRTLDADPSGTVRIGLPGTIGAIVALPLMKAARDRYPRIRLNIAEAMSGFVARWMTEGQVDIAVLYQPPAGRALASEPLLEEDLVILRRAGEGRAATSGDLATLHGAPMVLPSGAHGLRAHVDAALAERGIVPVVAVEIDSYLNIKRLVAEGFGASILPAHAVRDEVAAGTLVARPIAAPDFRRIAHLVHPAAGTAPRARRAIQDLLRETVAGLVDSGEWAGARRSEETLEYPL